MPELPEVETVRRQMDAALRGAVVADVAVKFGGRIIGGAAGFTEGIRGRTIEAVERRAKLLAVRLSGGKTVIAHLKMTGRFLLSGAPVEPSLHTHVVFSLSDGRQLSFADVRKFGYLRLVPDEALESDVYAAYGPEPLADGFSAVTMADRLRKWPRRKVKPALLAQECIAGIGNIYADEACWGAGLSPTRTVESLSDAEIAALWRGTRESMEASLRRRGTSANDYVDLYGEKGTAYGHLAVYGREGEPCSRCGGIIEKIRLAGRGTHYCPRCQR